MKNTSVCTLGSAWEARATHIRQPPSQRGRWRSMTARQRRHFLVGAGDLGLACQTLRIVRDRYLRLHRCSRNVFAWVKFLFICEILVVQTSGPGHSWRTRLSDLPMHSTVEDGCEQTRPELSENPSLCFYYAFGKKENNDIQWLNNVLKQRMPKQGLSQRDHCNTTAT